MNEKDAIDLIASLVRKRCSSLAKGIGDDAAVFDNGLVVSVDAFIDGVHFDPRYLKPETIGTRAACATLSDMAAVCAQPFALFVSLQVPRNIKRETLKRIYSGMEQVCARFCTTIAGGDIVASAQLGLALTVLGKARLPRFRSGAKPGDYLYLTGSLGLAETGRLALQHNLSKAGFRQAIRRHSCPWPRISAALRLAPVINGLIDTSDGLSTDACHLAEQSRVKIVIDYERLRIGKETRLLVSRLGLSLLDFVVNSGEDYELLFTSPKRTLAFPGLAVTRIGRVESGRGVYLSIQGRGQRLPPRGYDHLSPKPG